METPERDTVTPSEDQLRLAMELLFLAYRDFTAEPDAVLARYGFGRAHHRVLYFVGGAPGMAVSELLAILRITKQSLARVLRQLVAEGFVDQRTDSRDKRRRLLHLTGKGRRLERQLREGQTRRIARAFIQAGPEAIQGFRMVLREMINPEDRGRVDGWSDQQKWPCPRDGGPWDDGHDTPHHKEGPTTG